MASLPSNLYGFPFVAVKEEGENPDFHIASSPHQFPATRQESTHAMMVASTVLSNSFTRAGSSRASGVNASTLQYGLPTSLYCNTVFQHNTTHIHRHQSSTILPDSINPHSAIPIGPPSNDDGRANTECLELFSLKLTHNINMLNWKCLVLPTKLARQFFPANEPSLMFWDQKSRRWWEFEYFRSRDGQCYQLVSGWSSFVEEKALKTGDTLIFSIFMDNGILQNSYYMIDVRRTVELFGTVIHID